jgi:alkylated DNA repair dioxygenase AlkB
VTPEQLDLFGEPASALPGADSAAAKWPEGFAYERDVISRDAEARLLAAMRELPFKDFEFHGYVGKRRTVSFGASYDFTTERLTPAEPFPDFLAEARSAAATFAALPVEALEQGLVTEYAPGAGIGWHRDKGVFGDVIGISLLSTCRFRLRRQRETCWERVTVEAEPRSAYLLRGPACTEWEHSIPEVESARFSLTFRTLRTPR